VILPIDEFPPDLLSTDQVTDVFELPVTVASNCSVAPVCRVIDVLFRPNVTGGGVVEFEVDWFPHPVIRNTNPSASKRLL
jgi:hypothetical protein